MMKSGFTVGKLLFSLMVAVVLAMVSPLYAQSRAAVKPNPLPGPYPNPVIVSFSCPAGYRLQIGVDGNAFSDYASPILLSASEGEERVFSIETALYPLQPGLPALKIEKFVWIVDRKSPAPPSLNITASGDGYMVSCARSAEDSIRYRMWHPRSSASADGTLAPGGSVFLPEGAAFCATAVDRAGNRSETVSADLSRVGAITVPFRVVSPAPGTWANRQSLIIDCAPETLIRYSLDGSDPRTSPLVYDGPILLDREGQTVVKLVATDASGKDCTAEVMYTVSRDGAQGPGGFPADSAIIGGGDFTELVIPEGYTWAFGDSFPSTAGGKTIPISSARGILCRYPLIVSDGNRFWRYICESGSRSSDPVVQPSSSDLKSVGDVGPRLRVHDWYFVSFDWKAPVYYSLDGVSWIAYREPIFVDRSRDATLRWYSAEWKKGEVQIASLLAKPEISGVALRAVTDDPVFLSVPGSSMTFKYSGGTSFYPARPGADSTVLASGLLFEVPAGAEGSFKVRFLAESGGIEQGELYTEFTIDRKSPRVPLTGLETVPVWSRAPVSFTPSGDDTLHVEIAPPIFSQKGNVWTLEGDPARPVDYIVSVFAQDLAGNRSEERQSRVTVDLNAIYVGTPAASDVTGVSGFPEGSPQVPFSSLDRALDAIGESGAWRVILQGGIQLEKSHTLCADVDIRGEGATILAGKDAAINVTGGSLSLSNISLTQDFDLRAEDRILVPSGCPASLFSIVNARFSANGLEVERSGGDTSCLLRASHARISFANSRLSLGSRDYAILLDVSDSDLTIEQSSLFASARTASVLGLTGSSANIESSSLLVAPSVAARAIESWGSKLSLSDILLERKTDVAQNRDTAFWLDAKSRIVSESGLTVRGFYRSRGTGSR